MKVVRRGGDYIRIFFREFKPGEIFNLVTRINGRGGKRKIIDIGDAFTLPDTVAGFVEYGSDRRGTDYPPFIGETVIEKIGGRRVGHYSHLEPLPDGRVAGAVQMYGGPAPWIFFKGDTIIERIEGKKIIDTSEKGFVVLPDGTLAGNVEIKVEGKVGVWEAFKGESFIKRIGGKEVEYASILQVWCDGTLVGVATLKDERNVPFKGDALIEEIQGMKVMDVDLPLFLPDGILAGVVTLEGGKRALFKDGILIESIGDKRIVKPELTRYSFLPDGTLVGTLMIEGCENRLLFVGDTLIDNIGEKRFRTAWIEAILPGDVLAGDVSLEDGRRVPFVGDRVMDEVHGMKVLEGSFLFKLPNGEPVCLVKLDDGKELLLKGDTLIERIGDKKVVRMSRHASFLPDGTLVGTAKLEGIGWTLFRGDTLLEEVQGKKVRGGGLSLLTSPRWLDGTVTGTLSFDGEKLTPFFWYGDEVHLPLQL
ncbi:MAG: hypothetical protein QXU11_03425 [Thermoproteota archaeon]